MIGVCLPLFWAGLIQGAFGACITFKEKRGRGLYALYALGCIGV